MKTFDKIVTTIEEVLLSISVLAMAAILIAGVFARTIGSSLTFTEEVGLALNVVITFLGIGYCAKQARHISMSIFFDLVGKKGKKTMMTIIMLLSGIIMIYLTYLSSYYVFVNVMSLGRVTAALRIPMWALYSPIPLGFLLGAIEYFRAFFKNITTKDEVYISSKFKLGENMDDVGENNGEVKE